VKRARFPAVVACALVLVPPAASAADTPDPELGGEIGALLMQYAAHSAIPVPALDDETLGELLAGKSLVDTVDAAGTDEDAEVDEMGLVGLQYVQAPRLLVWLSLLGGGDGRDSRLTSAKLASGPPGSYVRYQHVDLPWPIRDRHWVILCEKNPQLAAASDGAIWEHRWALHADGPALLEAAFDEGRIPRLGRRDLANSIYLPANRGTWVVFDLGQNRSLILAFYDSNLGGRLPARLVRSFTRRQLQHYLEAARGMAERAAARYAADSPIYDGFARPITEEQAMQAARGWAETGAASRPAARE